MRLSNNTRTFDIGRGGVGSEKGIEDCIIRMADLQVIKEVVRSMSVIKDTLV